MWNLMIMSSDVKSMIKIMVIGEGISDIYERIFFKRFKEIGYETKLFTWNRYFEHLQDNESSKGNLIKLISKIQDKYKAGPKVNKLNKDLIEEINEFNPKLVFIYRGVSIYNKTLKKISSKDRKIFGYINDDLFSNYYPWYFWRHAKKSLKYYDHMFCFRKKNINDFKAIGYHKTSLLLPYYIKEKNFKLESKKNKLYKSDIIFIGHFENDGRDEILANLIKDNYFVKLYGTNWERSKYYNFFIDHFGHDIYPLFKDYNTALNSSKIALVFLSKLNNDVYTRRNFEIPTTNSMMISEYTPELSNLFNEGIEAAYFRDMIELKKKLDFYLINRDFREEIVKSAQKKVILNKHEAKDRVQKVIDVYNSIN